MAKMRLTFEVDNVALFDRLRQLNGDPEPLGSRIVGVMLAGEASWAEAIGMGVYGVALVGKEEMVPGPRTPEEPSAGDVPASGNEQEQP